MSNIPPFSVHIDVDAVLEESALREAAAQAREERRIKAEQRREELKRKEKRPRRDPNKPRVPKIRIKSTIEFKPPPKPAKSVYPCILCPDQSTAYLLPVHRNSKPVVDNIVAPVVAVAGVDVAVEAVTDDRESDTQASAGLVPMVAPISQRKRPEFAHLSCVRSTPELWIADAWDENKERSVRRVMGVESIGRERWNLVSLTRFRMFELSFTNTPTARLDSEMCLLCRRSCPSETRQQSTMYEGQMCQGVPRDVCDQGPDRRVQGDGGGRMDRSARSHPFFIIGTGGSWTWTDDHRQCVSPLLSGDRRPRARPLSGS